MTINQQFGFAWARWLMLTFALLLSGQAAATVVNGTVYGGSEPLAGVELIAYEISADEPAASATSDSNGQYQLTLPEGTYNLLVQPPADSSFANTSVDDVSVAGEAVAQNVVLVTTASKLSGTVRDGYGNPINNVSITVSDLASGTKVGRVVSDENGLYSLPLSAGDYEVDIEHAGYPSNRPRPRYFWVWPLIHSISVTGDTIRDIDLPFVTLSGRTVDANGVAVAGVTLKVDSYWGESNPYSFRKVVHEVTSDADGTYSIVVLSGLDTLTLIPPAGSGYAQTVVNGLTINESRTEDFVLQSENVLSGIVRDGNGNPINNVSLTVNDLASGTTVGRVVSDQNGFYSLPLSTGDYEVDIEHAGYPSNQPRPRYFWMWPLIHSISVAGDTVRDIDLPFVTLSGRTVDENGVAVAGVILKANSYWGESNPYSFRKVVHEVTSDTDGAYSIVVVSGLDTLTLVPPAGSGFAQMVVNGLAINQSRTEDFVLQNENVLSGIVRDGNGNPINNVSITVNDLASGSTVGRVVSDENGFYSLPLSAGDYEVDIEHAGYPSNQPRPRYFWMWPLIHSLSVTEDTVRDIDLPFVTVSGRTVDTNGVAVAGVTLKVDSYWGESNPYSFRKVVHNVVSANDGSYELVVVSGLDAETIIPPTDSGFAQTVISGLDIRTDLNQEIILPFNDTQLPQIIAGPFVTDITDTEALVSWQTDEPATSAVTGDVSAAASALVTDHQLRLTDLTPATEYAIRGQSFDAAGNGPVISAAVSFATRSAPDTQLPTIISGPVIEAITDSRATVIWETSEPTSGQLSYGTEARNQSLSSSIATQHRLQLEGLAAATRYQIQVAATDAADNGPVLSPVLGFNTAAAPDLEAPVILSGPLVSDITDRSVSISWTTHEPADSGVSYNDGVTYGVVKSELFTQEHRMEIVGLSASTSYTFTVSSTDKAGNGPTLSNPVTVTTLPAPDTDPPSIVGGVQVCNTTHQSIQLCWDTDEPASAWVEFGSDAEQLDQTKARPQLIRHHVIPVTGLESATDYHFRVSVSDRSGNRSTSPLFTARTRALHQQPELSFTVSPSVQYLGGKRAVVEWQTSLPADGSLSCSGDGSTVQASVVGKRKAQRVVVGPLQQGVNYNCVLSLHSMDGQTLTTTVGGE